MNKLTTAKSDNLVAEINMYGCTFLEFMESVNDSVEVSLARQNGDERLIRNAYEMVAMSLMSDAQEEMDRGMKGEARRTLNRAKAVLMEVHRNPAVLEQEISEE